MNNEQKKPEEPKRPEPLPTLSEKETQELSNAIGRLNMLKLRAFDLNAEIEAKQDELKAVLTEVHQMQAVSPTISRLLAIAHNIEGEVQFTPDLKTIMPAQQHPNRR